MMIVMPISEAARADLYHGLAEVFGTKRAETLMSVLPSYELTDLATKGDVALLSARIDSLEISLGGRIDRLEARMDRLETRMDRFFVALVTGMFVIVATLIGGFITL